MWKAKTLHIVISMQCAMPSMDPENTTGDKEPAAGAEDTAAPARQAAT